MSKITYDYGLYSKAGNQKLDDLIKNFTTQLRSLAVTHGEMRDTVVLDAVTAKIRLEMK